VCLVAVAAGLLIGTNAGVSGADDRSQGGLVGMVESQVRQVAELEEAGQELTAEVEELSTSELPPASGTERTDLGIASGRLAVEGPGITVTLDDAPAPAELTGDIAPDAYVVHQQDVEGVLNTLWAAGAEAVAIQGQRLTSVSVVRCVGNVLLLGGRTYSPPYVIDAIGDPEWLATALRTSPLTEPYRQWAERVGLTWSVKSQPSLRIEAYAGGSITLRYIASSAGVTS
jgi:uncharacterized protein YlxW (UPF0749 family)